MKKPFRIHSWNHILIEGFCFINIDYDHAHSKSMYILKENRAEGSEPEFEEIPNPDYDPSVKPDIPPKYCKKRICNACLGEDGHMCPHFGFSDVDDDFGKAFGKMIKKFYEREHDKTFK